MNCILFMTVLLACAALSHQDEAADHKAFIEKFHVYKDECIKETNANKDLITQALDDGKFTDDKNMKCYFKCIFQKIGLMDAAGNVDMKDAASHIPSNVDQAKAKASLDKCKDLKTNEACETAFQIVKCMREAYGPMVHNS